MGTDTHVMRAAEETFLVSVQFFMFCNIKVIALSVLCTRLSSSLLSLKNSLFIAHASDH